MQHIRQVHCQKSQRQPKGILKYAPLGPIPSCRRLAQSTIIDGVWRSKSDFANPLAYGGHEQGVLSLLKGRIKTVIAYQHTWYNLSPWCGEKAPPG